MRCTSCNFENREGVRFCENCGESMPEIATPVLQSVEIPCPKCGEQNRPDVRFCENCGMTLATRDEISTPPKISSTKSEEIICPDCQTVNRAEVRFCENCGYEFAPIRKGKQKGRRDVLHNVPKSSRPRRRRRILGWVGSILRKPIIHRPLIAAFLIFSAFFTIGVLTTPQGPVPVIEQRSIPLVTWEGVQAGERIASPGKPLSAAAWDDTGVARVEVYVDGEMVSAKNNVQGGTNTSISYPIPLGNIGQGNHEVFTRVYGADGDAGQSSIVFIDGATFGGSQSSAAPAEIEPAPEGRSAPTGVSATVTSSGEIRVTWEAMPNASEYRVYGRFPDSSSLILIGEMPTGTTEFSFPVDREGQWEVYVAGVDYTGREGSLGRTTHEVKGSSGSVEVSSGTLPAAKLDLRVPGGIDRLYAYIRIGGGENRYQRLPETGFLTPTSDGRVVADIPALGWPSDQTLYVEFEVWGWQGSTLNFIDSALVTIPPEVWTEGSVTYGDGKISAAIALEGSPTSAGVINPPATAKSGQPLPPPGNIHFPRTKADCLNVATDTGIIAQLLKPGCKTDRQYSAMTGVHNFFLWEWPWAEWTGEKASESELTGYEIMTRMVNYEDGMANIGETITSVPFPAARGYFMLGWDQPLNCGLGREWYVRAVGKGRVSDWAFAYEVVAPHCAGWVSEEGIPAGYTGELPNGCGGGPTAGIVPEYKFHLACNKHDICYESWYSGKSKEQCDNEFFDNMWAACSQRTEGWNEGYCKSMVPVYYEAVNYLGHAFYNGPRNPLNCWKAKDREICLAGYSTVGLGMDIYNGGKAVAIATYNGGKLVVNKTADGAEWALDKGTSTIENGKDAFCGIFGC